jgi:hypothetical protein
MRRTSIVLVAFFVFGLCTKADTLQFTVPLADIGPTFQSGNITLFSSELDGTVLAGQSLSLDLVLANTDLARLFLSNPGLFGIAMTIQTNAGTFPGFVGTTVGYLLDPNGNAMGQPQFAGRADISDGSTSFGLVSFTSANLDGNDVVDISGVHFDTTLPNSGFVITNAELVFTLDAPTDGNRFEFGTAQQLPEPGTLLLLALGIFAVTVFNLRKPVTTGQ